MLTPLRVYSEYSLLKSTITAKEAIEYCQENNIKHIGLANENNMFGILQWTKKLKQNGIKLITGCSLKVSKGYIWVYCLNEFGYLELSNALTDSYLYQHGTLNISDINFQNCFILCDLSITEHEIIQLNSTNQIGIAISRQKRDQNNENTLFQISNNYDIPIVAAPIFLFPKKEMQVEADCLWCVNNGTFLIENDREKILDDEYFKKPDEYIKDFKDIPIAIENANILAKKCNFTISTSQPKMPQIGLDNPQKIFIENVLNGFQKRLKNNILPKIPEYLHEETKKNYEIRMNYEIDMITKMNFDEYFLIVAEIVQWSKKNNILVGPGRGSGAGSIVAFFLEITSIDPIKYSLMFERFLNPDRISLPDFDIDFCQINRHKVINFIKERFGQENVAHIITFGTLQYRAALRDVGRVLQIPYTIVDEICKSLPAPVQGVAPTLKELREKNISTKLMNNENEKLFKIAENVEGLPRHTSMHAAGVVIGSTKLANIVPLYKEKDSDIPIIQFDMKDADAVGLVKFDILGLTVLSTISKTLEFLKRKNINIDLENLNLKDQDVYKMISEGKTNSIFQMDSSGFKNLMQELQPDCFEDIIAAGALYRPGPMNDIPQFIACKHGKEEIKYFYPELEPILKETYGIPVYQEQVLEIAKSLANYSLKEADLLRRAMGKKIHKEMEEHKKKFVSGVLEICHGTEEKANEFFENLSRFASYGFNKSHSTCYGMISYQTAYLKYHYSIEYLCSSMIHETNMEKNSDIIQEAIFNMNLNVCPPCINTSNFSYDIINNKIYFGLSNIKGIGEGARKIIEERTNNGKFSSIQDFIKRTSPNKKIIDNLINSGALDSLEPNRSKQISEIENKTNNFSLFDEFLLPKQAIDWPISKKAIEEMHVLGYVFQKNFLKIESHFIKIHETMLDIKIVGVIYALGIKPIVKNKKDGKVIYAYEFFEQNGFKRLYCNNLYKIQMELVFIEIENIKERYFIKRIYTLEEYLKRYKKIFLDSMPKENLEAGSTSLFIQNKNETVFQQNIKLSLKFLATYDKNIISLS